jgi:predicted DNA-binding transcriptional regulator AlpA
LSPKDIEQRMAEIQAKTLWPFSDLKAQGIANDRATLRRREAREGFPQAVILSSNSVAWNADEVRAWLASRPRGAAPQPKTRRPRTGSQAESGPLGSEAV